MTDQVEDALAVPRVTAHRRWLVVLIAGALVLVVAAAVTVTTFDFTYAPLGPGNEMAPAVQANLAQLSDGIQTTQWAITGPTGSKGAVAYMLSNTGSFGVTIDGLSGSHNFGWEGSATAPHSAILVSLAWTPTTPNGGGFPVPLTLHSFPAHIPAGGSIAIDVSVTKPACVTGQTPSVSDVPVKWSAFGVHHTYDLPLTLGGFFIPIEVCPTRAALRQAALRLP